MRPRKRGLDRVHFTQNTFLDFIFRISCKEGQCTSAVAVGTLNEILVALKGLESFVTISTFKSKKDGNQPHQTVSASCTLALSRRDRVELQDSKPKVSFCKFTSLGFYLTAFAKILYSFFIWNRIMHNFSIHNWSFILASASVKDENLGLA